MHYLVYFVVMAIFFDHFSQMPIISLYARELGATSFWIGLVVGMYSFSNMAGNLVAGRWIDSRGRRNIMIAGLVMAAAGVATYALAGTAQQLAAARFVHGLGAGLVSPAAFALIGDRSQETRRGQAMAGAGAAIGVAAIAGPAYGGIMAQHVGWDGVFLSVAALLLVTAVLAWLLVEDRYQGGSGERGDPDQVGSLLRKPGLRRAFLGAFALMFAMGILVYALPLKVDALGFGSATTGMLMSAFGLVAILLFVSPANRLSDHLGRIKPAVWGLAFIAAALLALGAAGAQPALWGAMVAFGTGFAMVFPAMAALVVDETRSEEGTGFRPVLRFLLAGSHCRLTAGGRSGRHPRSRFSDRCPGDRGDGHGTTRHGQARNAADRGKGFRPRQRPPERAGLERRLNGSR